MTPHDKENDGYGYFLLVIDVFSEYVWTFPVKRVGGKEATESFRKLLDRGRRPEKLRSDKGSEFKSVQFQKLLKERGIEHFYALNETKAAVAERAIKTIKSRLARYRTKKQTNRWIDVLDSVTRSYNNTYHRSIKKSPASVKAKDEAEIWRTRYETVPKSKRGTSKSATKYRFKVGDKVRISHLRRPFQREYDERWTLEYFLVIERGKKQGIPFYGIEDLLGDQVEGTFYGNELGKINVDEDAVFRIEKVVRRRKNEAMVRWTGWPSKFDSWIPKTDLVKFGHA